MTTRSDIQPYAVFDFDGTVLDGHSPVMLVAMLFSAHAMPIRTGLSIALWGLRYKLRLPHDQQVVRQRIFNLFRGRPATEIDGMMERFYHDVIAKHVRPAARREIAGYRERDIPVVICSASFDSIVTYAARDLGVTAQLSTKMEVVDGVYTGRLDGAPVEGLGKRSAFVSYADRENGPGRWTLLAAYGDHYSDERLLELAEHPVAVDPDSRLRRIARRRGWEVRQWR